jgi:hypothetical protein
MIKFLTRTRLWRLIQQDCSVPSLNKWNQDTRLDEVRCRSRLVETTESRSLEGVSKSLAILRRPHLPVEFKRELQDMLHTGWKSEIQCLSIDDLCDQFLADKTRLVTE